MDIIFIRHAESTNNKTWAENRDESLRVPDPGLTGLGRSQADALAGWFPGFAPHTTHLFASPFIRTLETAAPLANTLDMDIVVKPDLMERGGPFTGPIMDQEHHPGSPRAELQRISSRLRLPDETTEDGWWSGPFETLEMAIERARKLADWVRRDFEPEDCIVLVSHGAIGSLFATALFCPAELDRRSGQIMGETSSWFALDNTSVSWFRLFPGNDTELRCFNRIDHLILAGVSSATMRQSS